MLWGLSCAFYDFEQIPGLDPLNTNTATPTHTLTVKTKKSLDIAKYPLEGKFLPPPGGEPLGGALIIPYLQKGESRHRVSHLLSKQ